MFSRLSNNAVNPSQDFTNAMTGRGGVRGARGGRGRGGGEGHLASNVLRRAGLVDEDAGMRDASAAGPSRTGAGGKRRGGADANGASSVS